MRRKVRAALLSFGVSGSHLTVAVSGGKDSMALLHCICSLSGELNCRVSAVHFHHGIRGEEADRDAAFVRDYCLCRGIPLEVGYGDAPQLAAEEHLSLEDAARRLRYAYFDGIDTDYILTAHTAGDQLETLLMRLIRGAGVHGLTGIPPRRGRLLRPMLAVETEEVLQYLSQNHIPHVEDSTNGEPDCLRNRLRQEVVPLLTRENPRIAGTAAELCRTLLLEDAFMDYQAQAAFSSVERQGQIAVSRLLSLHEALQYRVLIRLLSPVPGLSRAHLESARMLALGNAPSGEISLPGGFILRREYDWLGLADEPASPPPEPRAVSPGETVSFGPFTVVCRAGPRPAVLPAGVVALNTYVPLPLQLRTRQAGDVIALSGGRKKVSRLMLDRKVPSRLRHLLPVAVGDGDILAVLPLRGCGNLLPGAGEPAILLELLDESGDTISFDP